jgi:hypothetical protein
MDLHGTVAVYGVDHNGLGYRLEGVGREGLFYADFNGIISQSLIGEAGQTALELIQTAGTPDLTHAMTEAVIVIGHGTPQVMTGSCSRLII